MNLTTIMPMRNESWCAGISMRAVLQWSDHLVALDHASTDSTPEIIREVAAEFPGRVHAFRDDNPEWQEMRHRQLLLDEARKVGADVICLVDADEILSANLVGVIRDVIRLNCRPGCLLQLPWACIARGGTSRYYTDGVWFDNWVSTAFMDSPRLGWSSASQGGYDFHHRHPMGQELDIMRPVRQKGGGLMHLQFASERRVRSKALLYTCTEMLRWPGRMSPRQLNQMYGRAVYESDPRVIATEPCPESWWGPYAHLMKYLDVDAEPWQLAKVRELAAEHGKERFAGLDSYGLDVGL